MSYAPMAVHEYLDGGYRLTVRVHLSSAEHSVKLLDIKTIVAKLYTLVACVCASRDPKEN